MSKSIQIQIPKPCHENWNAMDETTKGRFCNSCCKEVIDFTLMSDSQIVHLMSKAHQNVCGRFADDQLDRNLIMKNERKFSFLKYFIHVIIPALLISNKTSAQGKITGDTVVCTPPKLTKNDTLIKPIMVGKILSETVTKQSERTIIGKVIDENHSAVPFATILIKGTKRGVSANADGMFELKVSSKEKRVILTASGVGHQSAETILDLKNSNQGTVEVSIQMKLLTTTGLGELVVVAGYSVVKNKEKKHFLQPVMDTIMNVFIKDAVKIYPNPVYRGGEFNMDFDIENPGEYDMIMLNSSGQIVMEKRMQVSSKKQTEQIICDGRLVPGIYILQTIEHSTKKNYTNKIIVL
jgi:hypothetical protein